MGIQLMGTSPLEQLISSMLLAGGVVLAVVGAVAMFIMWRKHVDIQKRAAALVGLLRRGVVFSIEAQIFNPHETSGVIEDAVRIEGPSFSIAYWPWRTFRVEGEVPDEVWAIFLGTDASGVVLATERLVENAPVSGVRRTKNATSVRGGRLKMAVTLVHEATQKAAPLYV